MAQQANDRGVIVCDLTAIAPAERAAHLALTRRLFEDEAREIRELPDGYAYRFEGERFSEVLGFMAKERLCCPFWSFGLDVAPDGGPIWLRLTGPDGAKELLK